MLCVKIIEEPPAGTYLILVTSSEDKLLTTIPGSPPSPGSIKTGCPFQPRCAYTHLVGDRCITERPELTPRPGEGDHEAACHLGRRPEVIV
jgi:peptide/nickel transport system ATP-binding protein